jgi:hypothetical protein
MQLLLPMCLQLSEGGCAVKQNFIGKWPLFWLICIYVSGLPFAGFYLKVGIQGVNRIGDVIIGGRCCEFDIKTEDFLP